MIKHNVIGLYAALGGKDRIDFLISHYKDFEDYVSTYKDYIYETMLDILSSSHRNSDDLGVRIQSSGCNSDATFRAALARLSVEKCFEDDELIRELFPDPYEYELVSTAIHEWDRLQREHRKLILSMKMILNKEEQQIFQSYFSKEKRLCDLAEDYCIEMESANKKVYRIRKKLVTSIEPWFDKYNMKIPA